MYLPKNSRLNLAKSAISEEVGPLRGPVSDTVAWSPTVSLPCGRCTIGYGADCLRRPAFALSEDEGQGGGCFLF